MKEFTTAQAFLVWLTSAAGLGVVVPFVVSLLKSKLKVDGWVAILLTLGVAILFGGGATLVLQFGLFEYVEPYWELIVAIATVVGSMVTFGSSQVVYHLAPRSSKFEDK